MAKQPDTSSPTGQSWNEDMRALQRASGLTQQEWADELGVPLKTAENWFSGANTPRSVTNASFLNLFKKAGILDSTHSIGSASNIVLDEAWLTAWLVRVRNRPTARAKRSFLVINCSHPIDRRQPEQLERLLKGEIRVQHRVPQFDLSESMETQIKRFVDGFEITYAEWQSLPIVVLPPEYAPGCAAFLAEVHGRMGYFPQIVRRVRENPTDPHSEWTVHSVIGLQNIRDASRMMRAAAP